ncbi:MAG: hypothetical protein M5R41_08325 [Bacteroidia bacterium]|nr:hypothetical protein [Bacteroidia bacterium]
MFRRDIAFVERLHDESGITTTTRSIVSATTPLALIGNRKSFIVDRSSGIGLSAAE